MACSHMNGCELFVQFAMNPALELWKISYCKSADYSRCERYKASLEGKAIPLILLPNGVNLKETENDGIGAASLYSAIIKHQTHMIKTLLRVGVDLNLKNIEGTTPLMAAAEYGVDDIAKILIDNGANVKAKNNSSETAYDIAMKHHHYDLAKLISTKRKS